MGQGCLRSETKHDAQVSVTWIGHPRLHFVLGFLELASQSEAVH